MRRAALALAIAGGAISAAPAQQGDTPSPGNPVKSAMKLLGFATDTPPAQDFVVKSRPSKEPDYIPVFQAPPEPVRPVLKGDELKAMQGDLDSVEKRADAARAGFPPAAAATAQQKAQAAKPKSAPKTANQ